MQRRATTLDVRRAQRRFHWEDFLQNAGLDVTQRGEEVGGECPYCHHKRQSFYLNVEKGVWKCHFCSKSGWGVKVMADVLRISIPEAVERLLANRAAIYADDVYAEDEVELADDQEAEEPPPAIELPPEFRLLAGNESITSRPYWDYALTRMTEEQVAEYGVGYMDALCKCPPEPDRDGRPRAPHDRYRRRIIVPVYHLGTLVTFVARAIDKTAKRKVDTPPGNEQYSFLFNLERVWGAPRVVITEGVFDAMAIPDMAVATFGKKVTDTQIIMLTNAGVREVVLGWDADADEEIWKNYLRLRLTFDTVTSVALPEGEDPASLGEQEMLQYVATARVPEDRQPALPSTVGDKF